MTAIAGISLHMNKRSLFGALSGLPHLAFSYLDSDASCFYPPSFLLDDDGEKLCRLFLMTVARVILVKLEDELGDFVRLLTFFKSRT